MTSEAAVAPGFLPEIRRLRALLQRWLEYSLRRTPAEALARLPPRRRTVLAAGEMQALLARPVLQL